MRGVGSCSGRFIRCRAPGEPGIETVGRASSWKNRSGTNAWTYMTVDVERGLVFAPTGSPTSDFYGADRKGQNLYGNSLLALDATTGKLKWFQQLVHHDIWDWDLPAAPTLIDVVRDGRKIPAVALITKMSTVFIFDRVTGAPIFGDRGNAGAAERRTRRGHVADATVPGQASAPLADVVRSGHGFLLVDSRARRVLPRALGPNQMYTKGIFTPPSLDRHDGHVPEHAGGRQLERAFLRFRPRVGSTRTS